MKITFLAHSGFVAELERSLLIFDCWQDPAKVLAEIPWEKPVYFFASHVHADHFSPKIFAYRSRAEGYILHADCTKGAAGAPVHFMKPGDEYETPHFSVKMYGSTDAGGSFMIRAEGRTIFHAGDLNWWHWAGEADAENRAMRSAYFEELGKISETSVDVAFFPVDARQAVAREWGAAEFLRRIVVRELFVPMHAFGTRWCPSYEFRWHFPDVPLWIPGREGESITK